MNKNNSTNMNIGQVKAHGEVFFCPICKLPDGLKKIKPSDKTFHIVGASENLGNHHVVDIEPGVEFYQNEKGSFFLEASVATKIRCLHANRHDEMTITPGTYEFGTQTEYDPFAARLQSVRD